MRASGADQGVQIGEIISVRNYGNPEGSGSTSTIGLAGPDNATTKADPYALPNNSRLNPKERLATDGYLTQGIGTVEIDGVRFVSAVAGVIV